MLALLADVLHGRRPQPVPAEAWPALKKELTAQTVRAMPAENLADLGLSQTEEMLYFRDIVRGRQGFHRLMKEQQRALSVLQEAGIPAVVLKGAAAARYYPRPEDRCMGDVDLLVQPQDFRRAYAALTAAGYVARQTPDWFYRHIGLHGESGVEVELHRHFSSSDDRRQNRRLDRLLARGVASRQSADVCGYPVSVLPPLENGLVLLGHINHHLPDGLGLRQIIDWMFYVEAVLDDAFWESGFAEQAEAIGMKRLAILVTGMCRKYLGLQKEISWCEVEPVCDELMEYILARGNFGRKVDEVRFKTVRQMKNLRNPFHWLKLAQISGLDHWEAAQRHRLLRPFAWCYQVVRWARLGVGAGLTVGQLGEASASAKELDTLMKKLGVTRT